MISIKNRCFTTKLIEAYCRFATEHFQAGYVTVVDRPYIHNVLASVLDPQKVQKELDAIARIASERRSQAKRIISRHERVSFIRWDELAKQTPQWLKAEVNTAFENKAQFFFDITQQTRRAIGEAVAGDPSAYAQFLVEETPVLLYCYYLFRGGVVDVYPGEIADYFWRLEASDYAEELPQATALATSHEGLAYIDFREIRQIIPVQSSVL